VVSRLLDAFGKGLGGGYNIGCKFKTTLSRSSLGEPARLLAHTSLVGLFHGVRLSEGRGQNNQQPTPNDNNKQVVVFLCGSGI